MRRRVAGGGGLMAGDNKALAGESMVDVRYAAGVQIGDKNQQINIYSAARVVSWPVTVGRAPLLADAFQSRPTLQAAVAHRHGSVVITQVATGDGGTGKTQLAAAAFREALPGVQVAAWVSATSRDALVSAYSQVWEQLRPDQSDLAARDAERDAVALLAWLETTDRAWLIVLDDIQDPVDLRGLWPTGPTGQVLATSRRRDVALIGHGRSVVDVGVFTPLEAKEFLARKLADSQLPDVLDQAEGLAADLGYLPLALSPDPPIGFP
jgi:hypothetical protein